MTELSHFCAKCGAKTTTFFEIRKVQADKDKQFYQNIWQNGNISISGVPVNNGNSTVISNSSSTVWTSSGSITLGGVVFSDLLKDVKNEIIVLELCEKCLSEIIADILAVQSL